MFQPLDDAAALFDPITWQTHLLNPEAAALVALLLERFPTARPDLGDVQKLARSDMGWDVQSPAFLQTTAVLQEAGLIGRSNHDDRGSGA
jgi:hypothetical protein